jgi:putative oligomerization/nucleic acid binding protein
VSGGRVARRVAIIGSVLTLVLAIVGFVVTLILNIFVLDKYNAYGEVPIPGSGSLQLPAGEVTVSFHTQVMSSPNGGGFPVPQLKWRIQPPDGVAEPTVTESDGSPTTVNNDAHVRVWVAQIPAAGTYNIETEGNVNGYISPRLAFGHQSPYGSLVWVFVGMFGVAVVSLIVTVWWSARARAAQRPNMTTPQPISSYTPTDLTAPVAAPQGSLPSYAPNDEGFKLEQLKTLASLRDSGALTEAEFQTEKRRILDGR